MLNLCRRLLVEEKPVAEWNNPDHYLTEGETGLVCSHDIDHGLIETMIVQSITKYHARTALL
jgi:hypothetical protein